MSINEKQVNYSRTVKAHAKIKGVNQAGIHFMKMYNHNDSKGVIEISCVNKKDGKLTSGLALQIPREDLEAVIEALKELL